MLKELWEQIVNYYTMLGERYSVDPVLFVGIHIVATPLFIWAVAWLVRSHRRGRSPFWPALTAIFVFNAANIYLVLFGRNLPFRVYAVITTSTLISGYGSWRKVKKQLAAAAPHQQQPPPS
ncbi:hypothetical protein [Flaviaesturariibacter amylovorans]|uniref:DUF2127 domain-containing protein n=1 Tax=Flaviaesturariibacter amylovorans TaxID=1084520 RepID=A0ABP8HQ71_9BACT